MTLKIKHKLALALLIASIISMSIIASLGYYIAKKTSTQQTFEKLTSIRNSKAQEISDYFHRLQDLTLLVTHSKTTIDAFEAFNSAFSKIKTNNSLNGEQIAELKIFRDNYFYGKYIDTAGEMAIEKDKFLSYLPSNKEAIFLQSAYYNTEFSRINSYSDYAKALEVYDDGISNFVEYSDFGGLLLINSETGDIIYTANKFSELGGNLLVDSLSKTNLAAAFKELRQAKNPEVRMVRFQTYFPTNLLPKAFMLCPVFKNGKNIAVVALRVPIDQVNEILSFNKKWLENGMGRTGEVYMVGGSNMMRSNSRAFIEDPDGFLAALEEIGHPQQDLLKVRKSRSTIINIKIETEAVKSAMNGESGIKIIKDYRDFEVLSAYMPLEILGLNYAVIAQIDTAEAFENVAILRKFMIFSFIAVLISMVIIAFLLANIVTKPINKLTETARELSKGNFQTLIGIKGNDEIGILAESFHTMQSTIVDLIGNLRISNSNLEDKQKEIFDSIRYARNIQNNILADHTLLKENLPDHFVFFSPKDVVSGDFYWAINVPSKSVKNTDNEYKFETRLGESFYFAVCDSTGHGIPGAFMSLLNVSYLNEAIVIKDIELPSDIITDVRDSLINALSNEHNREGMDGVLIYIDPNEDHIHYAGGYNAPIIVRDNTVIKCEIDKMPIGKGQNLKPFTDHHLKIKKGDMLYLYSDGFPDQFGGPQNKKYKYSRFYEFLLSISSKPALEQKELLIDEFEKWRGSAEQTDDVLVVGIRF